MEPAGIAVLIAVPATIVLTARTGKLGTTWLWPHRSRSWAMSIALALVATATVIAGI
jgi:hypothetical protein